MRKDYPEICLYQPEIPQNTGAIGRLVAGAASRLHLLTPFGFSITDRDLKRPGLDYWPYLDLEIHDDFEKLLSRFDGEFVFLTKFAEKIYTQIPLTTKLIVFGRETSGLPNAIKERYREKLYRIPMLNTNVRSLNLANSVSVVLYDQLARRNQSQWGPFE